MAWIVWASGGGSGHPHHGGIVSGVIIPNDQFGHVRECPFLGTVAPWYPIPHHVANVVGNGDGRTRVYARDAVLPMMHIPLSWDPGILDRDVIWDPCLVEFGHVQTRRACPYPMLVHEVDSLLNE